MRDPENNVTERIKIGLLTPSSNTIMEPRASAIFADLPGASVHFGRFRVTQIAMSDDALGQFGFEPQLQAAELLAEARCDVIAWGGTSGGWLGTANDRALCAQITARTGAQATTSTLATLAAFRALGVRRYGLVTPYLSEIQAAVQKTCAAEGFDCAGERHLEDRGNYSFAAYDEPTIAGLIRDVAASGPEAIAVFCTNFDGTRIAPELERETGISVIDSISVTLWHCLRLAGVDTSGLAHWGGLFALDLPAPQPQGRAGAAHSGTTRA